MFRDYDNEEIVKQPLEGNLTEGTTKEASLDNITEGNIMEFQEASLIEDTIEESSEDNPLESAANESLEEGTTEKVINETLEATAVENSSYKVIESIPKKGANAKVYISLVLASSIITGVLVGGGLYYRFSKQLKSQTAAIERLSSLATFQDAAKTSVNSIATLDTAGDSTVTKIAKKVGPSIVGIRVTVGSLQRFIYGNEAAQSEGSGVIISKDGYIMTNYHVVKYADPKSSTSSSTTLEVFLSDKTQAKAKFIGGDSLNDLAVIKIELDNLPAAELGDSSTLQVGELAVAIGNPLGLEFAGSVTTGVISAVNRVVQTDSLSQNLIQTDAAINPGNSGGALLNSKGQVIGINSAKITDTGVEGLGFAIPINDAKPIINQLVMFGYVKGRPFIGISGQDVSETIARAYNLSVGVYVKSVTPGSGAERAGIKPGDIITSLAGNSISSMQDINTLKKKYKAGDTVNITIVRNGNKQNLTLTFTEEK